MKAPTIRVLSLFCVGALAQANWNTNGAQPLHNVQVNSFGTLVDPNVVLQNSGAIITSPGATNGAGEAIAFVPPDTNTVYVAPWGRDTNSGTNRASSFLSMEAAERVATNYGMTIHLCAGMNRIGSTINSASPRSYTVQLANGVNLDCEPGAVLVVSNLPSLAGLTATSLFNCYGNNTINNLTLICKDTNTVQTTLGYGNSDNVFGHTNIIFNNLKLYTYGGGVHVETARDNAGTTNLIDMLFQGGSIYANANCAVAKNWRNCHIKFIGVDFTLFNFTNVMINNYKPLRVFDVACLTGTTPTFTNMIEAVGCKFHLSDKDLSSSNRPAFVVWPEQVNPRSNLVSLVGCSIDWISRTNPSSFDFSSNSSCVNISDCSRTDGQYLTFQADAPFDPSVGGIPTLTTNANPSLVASAFITGHDRSFVLNWVLSGSSQPANSNYFTVNLSRWWGTNQLNATVSEINYEGLTNVGVGSSDIMANLNVITSSNSITFASRSSAFTAGGMQTLAVHVDPLFTR